MSEIKLDFAKQDGLVPVIVTDYQTGQVLMLADLNVMRQTLLFGGLESIAHNVNRKRGNIRFFEFGKCYHFDASRKAQVQFTPEEMKAAPAKVLAG